MLSAALERIMPPSVPREAHLPALIRIIAEALRAHGVLSRLLAVQQLDVHDVEGAIQARPCSSAEWVRTGGLISPLQAYGAVLGLPAERGCPSCAAADGVHCSAREAIRQLPRPKALAVLRDFLIAQSAKDAAVMLALQPLPAETLPAGADEVVVVDAETCARFRAGVAFVDLELKRAASLPKYAALDRAVVAAWEGDPSLAISA